MIDYQVLKKLVLEVLKKEPNLQYGQIEQEVQRLAIQSTLDSLIKKKIIPYAVHQGSTEHLLSLFEMIRAERNDAVHPTTGQINKTKVFLTIQTLPNALEVVYRLIEWFNNNKI